MPYISTDTVKEIRNELKKALPEYKLSVRTIDYCKVAVTIKSGPVDLNSVNGAGYEQVNYYYIDKYYSGETQRVLNTINKIVSKGQREEVYDGDYGSVPTYYIGISIGEWDKPYIVTK